MKDHFKQLKGELRAEGIEVDNLSEGELAVLAAKTPMALQQWVADMRPSQSKSRKKIDDGMLPITLTEKEMLEERLKAPIAMDNIIIDAPDVLSKNAKQLLFELILLSHLKPETRPVAKRSCWIPVKSGAVVKTSLSYLRQRMGVRTAKDVYAALEELWEKDINLSVKDPKGTGGWVLAARWIINRAQNKETGEIIIQFNPAFFQNLSNLSQKRQMGFTKGLLPPSAFDFRCSLSYRLWVLAARWGKIKKSKLYSAQEFKELFGRGKMATKAFNRDNLWPALAEINNYAGLGLLVDVIPIPQGRGVGWYKMVIEFSGKMKLMDDNDAGLFPTETTAVAG